MAAADTTDYVYIVPCGGEKTDHAAPARDLYTGQMFRHTLAAAQAQLAYTGGRVLILSALHGLVELDTVLDPYNVKMGEHGSVTAETVAAQAERLGITWGTEMWNGDVQDRSEVYAFLPRDYYRLLATALATLDVYPTDVYEAAPGIGYQRGVNVRVA